MLLIGTIIPASGNVNVKISSMPLFIGNTLYVGGTGPENYTKIQDAIDNASNGDTVFVYDDSSPYYENVYVRKSINLIGENKCTTVIDGGENEDVVYISPQWVNISGFTIQNSGTKQFDAGIEIHSNYNTITDNKISNNMYGIWILNWCKSNTITGNNISNNWYGIESDGNRNVIQKNNFLNNYQNAFFSRRSILKRNLWRQNYWNKPQLLPELIHGKIIITLDILSPPWDHIEIPWFAFDWHPAPRPYDI